MTPTHVELSGKDFYGISIAPARASELAEELTKLFAAMGTRVTKTHFDDWPDEFLSVLDTISRFTTEHSK